jgi:MFS family permease
VPVAAAERRAFWLYWASTTTSYLGDGIRFVALPLLAATLTSSPAQVASIALAAGLPWPMFGLIAGVVVDRLDKNQLLLTTQAMRAALGFVIAFGVATGHVSLILLAVFAFTLNVGEVLYDIALHSYLPALVPEAMLQRANSRLITAETVVFEFAGPAAGGFLFAKITSLPFFADAATFGFSAGILWVLGRRARPSAPPRSARPDPVDRNSVRSELGDGLRWFWSHTLMRSLTFVAAANNLGLGGLYAVLVLFVKNETGRGAGAYGFLIALGAVGSVAGGLAVSRLTGPGPRRAITICTAPVTALLLFAMAGSANYLATALCLIVSGFVVTQQNVVAISLRQALIPAALIGRVTAVHRVICWGVLPLGALLSGLAGQVLGVRAAIGTCGAAVLLLSVIILPGLLRIPPRAYIHQAAAAALESGP